MVLKRQFDTIWLTWFLHVLETESPAFDSCGGRCRGSRPCVGRVVCLDADPEGRGAVAHRGVEQVLVHRAQRLSAVLGVGVDVGAAI